MQKSKNVLTRKIMLKSDLIFAPGGWTLWLALSLFSLSLPSRETKEENTEAGPHSQNVGNECNNGQGKWQREHEEGMLKCCSFWPIHCHVFLSKLNIKT